MRSVTAPSDAFLHSSPISWRTRNHDDPSGASVAILTTIGAARAAPGTDNAAARRRTAARLIEKKVIHPPFQPARAALGHEVAHPVLRRRRPRVEDERAVEEVQEPLPVLGCLLYTSPSPR